MKNKKIFLAIAAMLMTIASCVKVEDTFNNRIPTNSKGEYAILFGNPTLRTKATIVSTSETGYDTFSLFSWNALNDTIMNPYTVQANGANSFQYDEVSGQELKYFKKNSDWYDFIGVIPTTHTTVLKNGAVKVNALTSFIVDDKRAETAVNLTDSLYWSANLAADSPEEFLWAQKRVEKANYGDVVSLPFNHGNALIFLGFSSDRTDTELINYVPGTPEIPEVPGTPDQVTTTSKATKFIDELVAGNTVQVAMGFIGASSSKLTKGQPNPIYVGSDNTANGYLAKTWLLSIKDAVNAQFEYYRLASITSNDKTPTTEDWESAASNKNIYMMKLASGVNATDFANGNDVFWNALVAHDYGTAEPWVGGSPAESFKDMFTKAYNEGWRVIRINVSDANANQVLVFLASNQEITTKVSTVVPGTPGTPAVPAVPGIDGIRVFSADETPDYCTHIPHTTAADATISSTGCELSNRTTSTDVIQFSLPATTTLGTAAVWSPSTFYALPGDANFDFIVVKLSYTYNGVTVYDVRVPIQLPAGGLQAGKYYKYELHITSTGNGTNDPNEATTEKDEVLIENNPVISIKLAETGYTQGDERIITF